MFVVKWLFIWFVIVVLLLIVLAVVAGLAVINVALIAMLWSVLERSDAPLPAKETPNA